MTWASAVGDKLNTPGIINVRGGDLRRARALLQANGIDTRRVGGFFGTRNFQVLRARLFDAQGILSESGVRWW